MASHPNVQDHPFDPGLQPERVALSWQRTALSVAIGSFLYARIILPTVGVWALLPVVAGLLLATVMGYKASRRYQHHHRTLTSQRGSLADGMLMFVIAGSVVAAGVFATLLALVSHFG